MGAAEGTDVAGAGVSVASAVEVAASVRVAAGVSVGVAVSASSALAIGCAAAASCSKTAAARKAANPTRKCRLKITRARQISCKTRLPESVPAAPPSPNQLFHIYGATVPDPVAKVNLCLRRAFRATRPRANHARTQNITAPPHVYGRNFFRPSVRNPSPSHNHRPSQLIKPPMSGRNIFRPPVRHPTAGANWRTTHCGRTKFAPASRLYGRNIFRPYVCQ